MGEEVHFWWSWRGRGVWCPGFPFRSEDWLWRLWWHWCPWFRGQKIGCPGQWGAWCVHCELHRPQITLFVPDLQGLAPNRIQDRQKSRLVSILKHLCNLILLRFIPISSEPNTHPSINKLLLFLSLKFRTNVSSAPGFYLIQRSSFFNPSVLFILALGLNVDTIAGFDLILLPLFGAADSSSLIFLGSFLCLTLYLIWLWWLLIWMSRVSIAAI